MIKGLIEMYGQHRYPSENLGEEENTTTDVKLRRVI